jgi:hypothetical protein
MGTRKIKLTLPPQNRPRNHLAIHPLMQKGGVFNADKVDVRRACERNKLRISLRKTDWLLAKDGE